jgi:hypothetical protein
MDMAIVSSASAVAVAILVLGIAASASAVVPSFEELLSGSRLYLAVTSVLGVAALIAGVVAVIQGEAIALAALVLATLALWAFSTNRHMTQANPQAHPRA